MRLSPPRHLSAEAKREWKKITAEIEIEPTDAPVLTLLVEAIERYRAATDQIKREGITVTVQVFGRSGNRVGEKQERHVSLITQKEASAVILSCSRALGLNQPADDEPVVRSYE
jgi:P27 family predicted phage terminase small subunit